MDEFRKSEIESFLSGFVIGVIVVMVFIVIMSHSFFFANAKMKQDVYLLQQKIEAFDKALKVE